MIVCVKLRVVNILNLFYFILSYSIRIVIVFCICLQRALCLFSIFVQRALCFTWYDPFNCKCLFIIFCCSVFEHSIDFRKMVLIDLFSHACINTHIYIYIYIYESWVCCVSVVRKIHDCIDASIQEEVKDSYSRFIALCVIKNLDNLKLKYYDLSEIQTPQYCYSIVNWTVNCFIFYVRII